MGPAPALRSGIRAALLLAGVALSLAACGDPGSFFRVRNESAEPIYVTLSGSELYEVDPGLDVSLKSADPFDDPVWVAAADCSILARFEAPMLTLSKDVTKAWIGHWLITVPRRGTPTVTPVEPASETRSPVPASAPEPAPIRPIATGLPGHEGPVCRSRMPAATSRP